MESMELCSVKTCWGNFAFDYVHSDSVVYAPHDMRDKRMLWDYLAHVINKWDGEVVTMGDFNEVRYKSDRFGLVFNVQGADVFNSFIANAGLEEVPLGGSSFMWCHKSATKMSKLDRFLISKNLLITCPNISATTLDRYLSDHRPILLRETQSDYGNNTKRAIKKYKEELEALDAAIDKGNGSDEIVNKKMEVINSMHHIDKIQAMDMAQKAKIKWSIEGDENSRFFHRVLNKKRSQLNIRGIMVDGVWTEKPSTVKHEFLQHFRRRFDKPTVSRAYVNMSYPKSITSDQQMDLERDVSKEELKRAVWDCGTDKSPGPDGFTFGFYLHFWSTIENDVFEVVKHFFTYGDIPKGCNSSFIFLIPKVPDANLVKDFRPISLIGNIYKIIAKILPNRLVGVLGDIINEVQSAFIAERQILDGPFILNEVDFEKAYGSVRWDFLDDVLKKFGFGNKCKWWMLECSWELSYAGMFMGIKLSLSLNLCHMFYADNAVFVGQWCDGNINTLVYVLECFYRVSSLRINMSKSKIMGVHVEDEKVKYAASKLRCLILNTSFSYLGTKVGGSMSRVQAWKEVVDKVKSRLSNWKMKALSIGGGLGVSSLYALNRGLMLKWVWRFYSQKTSLWARVIKAIYGDDGKVGKALETCKSVIVSKKLTDSNLDNSFRRKTRGGFEQVQYNALSHLVHAVTLVPLSDRWVWSLESSEEFYVASVRKVIDEKRLLNVNTMTRWIKCVPIKVNVLAWKIKIDALPTRLNISCRCIDIDSILCPICDCGVESSSHLFFSCSLAKQVARKISLWWDARKWEDLCHGCKLGRRLSIRKHHYGRELLRLFTVTMGRWERLKLGNGDTTAFWEDNWIGGNVLKYLYPRIYALDTCKSVTVSKELTDSSLDNSFCRKTRGGVEQVQYNDLSDLVHAVTLVSLSDRWVWSLESSGEFFVASVRKVIDEKRLSNVTTVTRCIKCVLIKVNVLAWKIKIDALPTKLNISHRGIDIDSILCPISDCGVESSSHLFFSCSLAKQVARKISLWWDVTYVDVNSYVEWVTWMMSLRLTSKLKLMLKGVFYVMWWDPEEESTTSSVMLVDTKSTDKGKEIMVEEPKPLKKKQQVEMDEEYARNLHAELNKDIDWDVAIEHVKQKAKEDPAHLHAWSASSTNVRMYGSPASKLCHTRDSYGISCMTTKP
nr:hypothetical protein [Tanacetum cinerariifolium]